MVVFRATMSASKGSSPLSKKIHETIDILEHLDKSNGTLPSGVYTLVVDFKGKLNDLKLKYFAEKFRGNVGGDENASLAIDAATRQTCLSLKDVVLDAIGLLEDAGCPIELASKPSPSKVVDCNSNIGTDVDGLVSVEEVSTSPIPEASPPASESKKTRPRVTPPKPEKHDRPSSSSSSSSSYKSTDARSVYGSERSSDKRRSRNSVERRRPPMIPIPVSPVSNDDNSPINAEMPSNPERKSVGVLASPKFRNAYTSTPSTWPVKKTLQHAACGPDSPTTSRTLTKSIQTEAPKPAEKVFRDVNGKIIKPPPGSIVWASPPKDSPNQESPEVKKHSRDIASLALSQLDGHATSYGIIRAYFLQGTNDIGLQTEATSTSNFNSQAGSSLVSTRDMATEIEPPTFSHIVDAESMRKRFEIPFIESAPSVSPTDCDSSRKRRNGNPFAESAPKRNRPSATTITETDGTDVTVDFKPEPSVPVEEEPPTQAEAEPESEELLPPMEATSSSTISSRSFAMPNIDFLSTFRKTDQGKNNSPPSIAASPLLAENPVVAAPVETRVPVEPEPVASTSAASEAGPSVPTVKEEVDDDVIIIGHKKDKRKKERRHSKSRTGGDNTEKKETTKEEDVAELVKRLVAESVQAQTQYVFVQMPMQTDGMTAGIPMGQPNGIPTGAVQMHLPPGAVPISPMNQFAPGGVPQGIPTSSMSQFAPGGAPPGIPVSPLQSPSGGPQFAPMTTQQFRMVQQQQQPYARAPYPTMMPQFQPNPQQHQPQMFQMPQQAAPAICFATATSVTCFANAWPTGATEGTEPPTPGTTAR
uniref:HTH La-type RNA-binding domain-containing protein n=1 Tax=Panagrellus redivivus TaxID=6233 RepID=A0A7E4VRV0_PANRE